MTGANIVTEIRLLTDTNTTSYTDAQILRRLNASYEEIVGKLIAKNGNWQFDDTNYTTFPIGTTTLVANQQDYAIDTTHLIIERVQVMDNLGDWHLLIPIDRQNLGIAPEEFMTTAGLPLYYDKSGGSIILYPAPAAANVTLASGLSIYFQRTASVFTQGEIDAGTKLPGFASPYHILLAYKVALPFCAMYKKDRVAFISSEIQRLEKELYAFEQNKLKDEPRRMYMGGISHH